MFRDCSRSFLDFYISKVYAAFDQISIDMKLNSSHLTSSVQLEPAYDDAILFL